MLGITRVGAAASAIALLLAAAALPAHAQETASEAAEQQAAAPEPDPDAVVARIGDEEVTEQDIRFAAEAFEGELANVPEAQRRSVTIDAYVNMHLLAKAAMDAGLDQTEDFDARLAFMKLQALRNLYVVEAIMGGVTDEDLQEAYQSLVVDQHTPEEQIRARHILVETKEEAEQIITELKDGASFEELAKERSTGPTGPNGGDLGFFGKGQMVAAFSDAAFALGAGEMTEEPVQTEFGWHVIKVEETRMSEPPAFSDVEPQLRNYVLRQQFESVLGELRERYPVEIVGAPAAGEDPAAAEEPMQAEEPGDAAEPSEESEN